MTQTWKQEKFRGLYSGLLPNLLVRGRLVGVVGGCHGLYGGALVVICFPFVVGECRGPYGGAVVVFFSLCGGSGGFLVGGWGTQS